MVLRTWSMGIQKPLQLCMDPRRYVTRSLWNHPSTYCCGYEFEQYASNTLVQFALNGSGLRISFMFANIFFFFCARCPETATAKSRAGFTS